jgi:hypothetical protein
LFADPAAAREATAINSMAKKNAVGHDLHLFNVRA